MRVSTFKAVAIAAFSAVAATSAAPRPISPPGRTPRRRRRWSRSRNWTGFYIGGNAGYSWGRSSTDVSYFNTATGLPIAPPGSILGAGFDMNGAIAGGQIGYNWQTSNWVFGLEADLNGRTRSAAVRL